MAQIIADLQLHSKYSRAVSPHMTLTTIAEWATRKGIDLVATGDWTHPLWIHEIQMHLRELGNGFLQLKTKPNTGPLFMLASEVSCIFSQNGKGRRVHVLIWVSTLASVLKINKELTRQGCNITSDGRPIIGLSLMQLSDLIFTIEPDALIIPAHVWTPWFGVFGSKSGFDSLTEAFGPFSKNIYAVETGLSSNPLMNWRVKELDSRSIVSFSDAHSGTKLGREATVFNLKNLSYRSISDAVKQMGSSNIAYTIEFYPEEGKYHWSGHRACNIRLSPNETEKRGHICPVCSKPLTEGVEQRIAKLAHRTVEDLKLEKTTTGMIISNAFPKRSPFVSLVPLSEIIAQGIGSPITSSKVTRIYELLTDSFGGEYSVLMKVLREDIKRVVGDRIADGIEKVRTGDISIDPGYDGVFGTVRIWKDGEEKLPKDLS